MAARTLPACAAVLLAALSTQLLVASLTSSATRPRPPAAPRHASPPPPHASAPHPAPLRRRATPPRPDPSPLSATALEFAPEAVRRTGARDPSGADLRCGHAIPPESILRTVTAEGAAVSLSLRASYAGETAAEVYTWSVEVQLTNEGSLPLRPLTVHWLVTTFDAQTSEVQGPAFRGELPVMRPGETWTITESVRLTGSPTGALHGSFQIEQDAKEASEDEEFEVGGPAPSFATFNARVGRIALSPDGREAQVPCVDEASEAMLPLTSVSSAQKVMLGALTSVVEDLSDPANSRYVFQYTLQLNNVRPDVLLLSACRIETVDEQGQWRHEEHAYIQEGGDETVKLMPGAVLLFQGRFSVPSRTANMHGYVVLIFEDLPERTLTIPVARVGANAGRGMVPVFQPYVYPFGRSVEAARAEIDRSR
ncbi:hypothetical protein AB1Y20_012767 [Prymnesium parvum]|uniref:ApaG domain-containing protein n=1 Tax=Prymnesium parvum TaxID=97485 RepID=A0AB34IJS2_PRYPA